MLITSVYLYPPIGVASRAMTKCRIAKRNTDTGDNGTDLLPYSSLGALQGSVLVWSNCAQKKRAKIPYLSLMELVHWKSRNIRRLQSREILYKISQAIGPRPRSSKKKQGQPVSRWEADPGTYYKLKFHFLPSNQTVYSNRPT